jgi:hypothetical protein
MASDAVGGVRTRRWSHLFVRTGLVLAAFVLSWLAQRQYVSWLEEATAYFRHEAPGWFAWLLGVMAAGFCFTLAAFLPSGRPRVRPLRALALAAVPALGILHFAAIYLWQWGLPSFLRKDYFYLDVGPQAVLAVFVGIGLAAGIRSSNDASASAES